MRVLRAGAKEGRRGYCRKEEKQKSITSEVFSPLEFQGIFVTSWCLFSTINKHICISLLYFYDCYKSQKWYGVFHYLTRNSVNVKAHVKEIISLILLPLPSEAPLPVLWENSSRLGYPPVRGCLD